MRNILICSANEDLLTALRAASGGGDVRLTVCRRGMDAVRAMTALSFDRLILDLETPGLDGPFLVSIARRIDPHLPIVAVSRGPVVQAREIQHKGVTHHLVPPPAGPLRDDGARDLTPDRGSSTSSPAWARAGPSSAPPGG